METTLGQFQASQTSRQHGDNFGTIPPMLLSLDWRALGRVPGLDVVFDLLQAGRHLVVLHTVHLKHSFTYLIWYSHIHIYENIDHTCNQIKLDASDLFLADATGLHQLVATILRKGYKNNQLIRNTD